MVLLCVCVSVNVCVWLRVCTFACLCDGFLRPYSPCYAVVWREKMQLSVETPPRLLLLLILLRPPAPAFSSPTSPLLFTPFSPGLLPFPPSEQEPAQEQRSNLDLPLRLFRGSDGETCAVLSPSTPRAQIEQLGAGPPPCFRRLFYQGATVVY